MRIHACIPVVIMVALIFSPITYAQPSEEQKQKRVYGWELMTPEERNEYRERLRSAKTPQELRQIRAEHREKMQQRAKERGVTLPDRPVRGPGGRQDQTDEQDQSEQQ